MRIIHIGDKVQEKQVVCPKCGSTLAYTDGDVLEQICQHLKCPVCSTLFPIEQK